MKVLIVTKLVNSILMLSQSPQIYYTFIFITWAWFGSNTKWNGFHQQFDIIPRSHFFELRNDMKYRFEFEIYRNVYSYTRKYLLKHNQFQFFFALHRRKFFSQLTKMFMMLIKESHHKARKTHHSIQQQITYSHVLSFFPIELFCLFKWRAHIIKLTCPRTIFVLENTKQI